ncbi:MbcA/ParS/Xre antitoxin family protein (plasmid) [Burkholderia pyrrocinia]|uniref:MbcA/ParS/Xre antitoxin family protein n=1 Tax=Burkholderia pyrrocinia TaxID=60550 RepID=UPI00215AF4EA|nr:MbcA/ParS/Xre antitoxin family protein [Burkholderia pyrrocinia]UVE70335.1 MbcA/ParS/Xre antitoxin family protein [Burkholderia pyrrocinia]
MSAPAEAIPTFKADFGALMSYLRDADTNAVSISPRRYISVLRLELQDLATQAHVHRSTISRAPDSETIQRFLRETLRVLRAATDVSGDVERAIFWFKNEPLREFDYKTAQTLVSEGRADAAIRYLKMAEAGFLG